MNDAYGVLANFSPIPGGTNIFSINPKPVLKLRDTGKTNGFFRPKAWVIPAQGNALG
jgi:hypothetical protein